MKSILINLTKKKREGISTLQKNYGVMKKKKFKVC